MITTAANRRVQNKVKFMNQKIIMSLLVISFDLTDDQETAIEDTLNDIIQTN